MPPAARNGGGRGGWDGAAAAAEGGGGNPAPDAAATNGHAGGEDKRDGRGAGLNMRAVLSTFVFLLFPAFTWVAALRLLPQTFPHSARGTLSAALLAASRALLPDEHVVATDAAGMGLGYALREVQRLRLVHILTANCSGGGGGAAATGWGVATRGGAGSHPAPQGAAHPPHCTLGMPVWQLERAAGVRALSPLLRALEAWGYASLTPRGRWRPTPRALLLEGAAARGPDVAPLLAYMAASTTGGVAGAPASPANATAALHALAWPDVVAHARPFASAATRRVVAIGRRSHAMLPHIVAAHPRLSALFVASPTSARAGSLPRARRLAAEIAGVGGPRGRGKAAVDVVEGDMEGTDDITALPPASDGDLYLL
jgi:hypothetical protein